MKSLRYLSLLVPLPSPYLNIQEHHHQTIPLHQYQLQPSSVTTNDHMFRYHQLQLQLRLIRLPKSRGLSVETSTNNRRFLMVFPLLTAALSTPPDIWCQIVAPFLIFSIIELAISVASIVQVREEGWTSGMRESGSIDKKE